MRTLRCAFLALFAYSLLGAQTTTLALSGPATVTPGNPATLTMTLSGSATQNISALQWSLTLPAGVTYGNGNAAASTTLAAAGTNIFCGAVICVMAPTALVAPALPAVMSDSAVATIPLNFAATVTPGTVSIPITAIFAASNVGFNVNGMTAAAVYTVKVLSRCDVNSDGVVNQADVQLVVNAIVGTGSCPATVAACNLVTVMQVVNAMGGTCKL